MRNTSGRNPEPPASQGGPDKQPKTVSEEQPARESQSTPKAIGANQDLIYPSSASLRLHAPPPILHASLTMDRPYTPLPTTPAKPSATRLQTGAGYLITLSSLKDEMITARAPTGRTATGVSPATPTWTSDVNGGAKGRDGNLSPPTDVGGQREVVSYHEGAMTAMAEEAGDWAQEKCEDRNIKAPRPSLHVEVHREEWDIPEHIRKIITSPTSPQHFLRIVEGDGHYQDPEAAHRGVDCEKRTRRESTAGLSGGVSNIGSVEMGRGIRGYRVGRPPRD